MKISFPDTHILWSLRHREQSRFYQHSHGTEPTVFLHSFEFYTKIMSDLGVFSLCLPGEDKRVNSWKTEKRK